jgi:hypothetical protein
LKPKLFISLFPSLRRFRMTRQFQKSATSVSFQNLLHLLSPQEKKLTLPILQKSLKTITECYQQSIPSLADTLILHSQISHLFILWFQELMENNHQLGLQYLLKYFYDLLLCSSTTPFSSPSSSSSFSASPPSHDHENIRPGQISLPYFNHSMIVTLLRLHSIYSDPNSPSGCCMIILKYVTYLLKYFIESNAATNPPLNLEEYASPHQWSLFLEEVILILMKRECSLSMIFNYGRCLNALSHYKRAIQTLIVSSLSRVMTAISSSMHHSVDGFSLLASSLQCNELESYLILSALSLFYSWKPIPSLNSFQLCDQLMQGMDFFPLNSRLCLFVCLSIKFALEMELSQPANDQKKIPLSRHCTTRWNLPERLIKIIHDHPRKYRLIVTALECFYLLVNPSSSASSSSSSRQSSPPSFMIAFPTPTPSLILEYHSTPHSPSPPLLFCQSSFPSTEERISSLISQWNPFLTAQYYDLRWQRRRSFCLFLVCCCRSSCVYGHWSSRRDNKQKQDLFIFPSLDLIFSSILPMRPRTLHPITSTTPLSSLPSPLTHQHRHENVKLIEKILFSKSLCLQISSFL